VELLTLGKSRRAIEFSRPPASFAAASAISSTVDWSRPPAGMADEDEDEGLEPDVTINIHKGRDGYGIYFAQQDGAMVVTKLDPASEAVKAGVQVGDRLLRVQDNDKKMPIESPGKEIIVNTKNYSTALQMVREMKYCKLSFLAAGDFGSLGGFS